MRDLLAVSLAIVICNNYEPSIGTIKVVGTIGIILITFFSCFLIFELVYRIIRREKKR